MQKRHFAALVAAIGLGSMSLPASADLIFDNGPLETGAVSRASGAAVPGPGVAAPAGNVWSEIFTGNTSAGATASPSGATGAFRLADDFTLSANSRIDTVTGYAYMTGSTDLQLFTTGTIRIWDGRPDLPTSNVLFGDTTTDRLIDSAATNIYRLFATDGSLVGGVNNVPGTTRRVKSAVFDIGGLNLNAGTYWVDYQIAPVAPLTSVFHPSVTLTDARNRPTDNAIQFTTAAAWVPFLDTGSPAALPDLNQDLAFRIDGVVPEPGALALVALSGVALLRRRA